MGCLCMSAAADGIGIGRHACWAMPVRVADMHGALLLAAASLHLSTSLQRAGLQATARHFEYPVDVLLRSLQLPAMPCIKCSEIVPATPFDPRSLSPDPSLGACSEAPMCPGSPCRVGRVSCRGRDHGSQRPAPRTGPDARHSCLAIRCGDRLWLCTAGTCPWVVPRVL